MLAAISADRKQTFFAKWIKKRLADDYLCKDITSVSFCSEQNKFVKNGYNRDGDSLPHLNLAILFGQKSGLAV